VPYATLASEMKTSEGALKVAVHRLRKRYRELLRQEIADTVADPADVDSELQSLVAALSSKGGPASVATVAALTVPHA
jgi:RNA polymerase sigma-70 factor (ECF subfamily)